ncbi:MAG: hypothetical protein LBS82_01500 [Spirochaetaceae bacterium]|nr:hypothetical protein [Spirochaetaceae bacterium]
MKQSTTMTVEVIDAGVLRLLRDLEQLSLIRLSPFKKPQGAQKLSQRFAGALHMSDERYAAFQTSMQKGRDEWKRPIS